MKRTLLLALLAFTVFSSKAQLASGTLAPDFTATDINGNVHTLSDYLDAGKTVIIDISATWCGPCWTYHNNHVLDDIYESYGGGGSDEVVVLFVEGDGATTNADLYGTGSNTQGDWVTGSPYPIIDSATIASLYAITYFPTIYRICPTGIVTEVGQTTALALRNSINSGCGIMDGVQNHAAVTSPELRLCSNTTPFTAKMKNYGKNAISSASLDLKEDGEIIATQSYSGLLAQFSTANVSFGTVTFSPGSTYEVEATAINTQTPFNTSFASQALEVTFPNYAETSAIVKVYTDNYPSEMSWTLKNSAGTTVASGGPYAGPASGGGVNANTTISQTVTLPLADDCYKFILGDTYGDGWSLGATPHGIEVFSNGVSVFQKFVGSFGTSMTINAAFKTSSTLGIEDPEPTKVGIYPNPSSGIFNFSVGEMVSVSVSDITGKVVFTANNVNDGGSINLSSLQKGMYIAKVKGATVDKIEKLVIR